MNQRRSHLFRDLMMVLAWTATAVLAGAVAWAAVARLGQDGTATSSRPLRQTEVLQQLQQTQSRQHPGPPGSGAPTRAAPPSPGSQPSPQPRSRGRDGSPASRSWRLSGGTVGVVCRGTSPRLLYASPADGWAYRLDTWTATELGVEFTRAEGASRLVVHCAAGVPSRSTGEAEQRGDSGTDD